MRRKGGEGLRYAKEKQGELFTEFRASSTRKPGYLFKPDITLGKKIMFNLSYENLILFFIVFIMLLVVFFALGVEKGKRIGLQNNKAAIARRVHKASEKETLAAKKGNETIATEIDESVKFKIVENSKTIEKEEVIVSAQLYTIQVIAFKKEKKAKKEMQRLEKEGHKVFAIPSEEWIQVCVGRYTNKEEYKKDLTVLKKRYPTCYVRKIE